MDQQPLDLHEVLRTKTVDELCSSDCPLLPPSATLGEAAEKMRQSGRGCLLVAENERLVGVLTERDWLRLVATQVPTDSRLDTVMTGTPTSVRQGSTVLEAVHLMVSAHCRRVPVVNESHLPVGVVDVRDIVQFLADLYPHTIYGQASHAEQDVQRREGA